MDLRLYRQTPIDSFEGYEAPAESRRAVRRQLRLPCELVSHYRDEAEHHVAADVSPIGMWIDTMLPLHAGAEVVVGFRPPRYHGPQILVFATVTRVVTGRRRADRGPLGMALEFADITPEEQEAVNRALSGVAPRINRRRWAA